MKKILLIIAVITFTSTAFAQVDFIKKSEVKTTQEEYNFLTEKLANQDNVKMLNGYEFVDLFEKTIEDFVFNYKKFVEIKTGNTKAIYVKITKIKKKEDKVEHICIPFNNPDLLNKFEKKSIGLGINMGYLFNQFNTVLFIMMLDEKFNVK